MTKRNAPLKPPRFFTWNIRAAEPPSSASRTALDGCDAGCEVGVRTRASIPKPVKRTMQ